MAITHTKVLTIPDGADTDQVRPSDWNAEHEGGEPFNGGTITEPLIMEGPTPDLGDPILDVMGDSGGGLASILRVVVHPVLGVGIAGKSGDPLHIVGGADVSRDVADGAPMFLVYDAFSGDAFFRVDEDGSVHIKTGTSIVADL